MLHTERYKRGDFYCFQTLRTNLIRQLQRLNHRHNQQTTEEIADAMDKIPGQSGHDPGKHRFEIQPEKQGLRRGIQRSKQKPVRRTNGHIYNRTKLRIHIPGQKHRNPPENGPQIQIRNPPCGEACEQSVDKHIGVNWKQRFFRYTTVIAIVNTPSRCTFGKISITTFEAYISAPSIPKTAISRMVRRPFTLP